MMRKYYAPVMLLAFAIGIQEGDLAAKSGGSPKVIDCYKTPSQKIIVVPKKLVNIVI